MGWRSVLAALLCCASLGASASQDACSVVVRTTLDTQRAYDSVVAAVDAMRREHLDRSVRADREFVGAVVADRDGAFLTTVGSACSGQDTVTFAVQVPSGMSVAAFWHTHGAPAMFRELFSPDDVDLVRSTGRDFYLITPRGELRVLRPSDIANLKPISRKRADPAPPNGAAVGHAVTPPRGIEVRVTRTDVSLPTESRGDSPVG